MALRRPPADPRWGKKMERRLHTRHRARTTVYIMLPGGVRRLCRAVNLSATGVFIRTAGLGLRKGQQVSLAFAIDLGAVTKLHCRTAVVAHGSGRGPPTVRRWHRADDGRLRRRALTAITVPLLLGAAGASTAAHRARYTYV